MSCLLPCMCIFCVHYNRDWREGERECAAFHEIPEDIFEGRFDHSRPYPGDHGFRFMVSTDYTTDFLEVNALRASFGLEPYAVTSTARRRSA